ncbi:hypothetical protein [Sphaerisporangium aureirubrum]|uniref:DUF222 domain-containing protein n=1 Tax=Sphaerisporangium aureirubrum TaxID=1544736 RepID=A0ABW1N8W6_9ACTN
MDEFVGVEPASLQELAHRLQRLHSLLAEHGPAIQRTMRRWDSTLSFAALPYLIDEALRDARDMDARATKAHELTREQPAPARASGPAAHPAPAAPTDTATPEMSVRLDWDSAGHGGVRAEQDAGALAEVVARGDPGVLSPEDLTRHLGDAGYLAAFWGQACPIALQAARTLINRAGPALFGPESTAILRALGASLAAATRMRRGNGADSRPLLSDAALDAIVKHPDQWSVGMLVRYGPDGRSWDCEILATITRAVLEAHAAGLVKVPERARGADSDPVAAVLRRAAENGHAARRLLTDPSTCPEHAALLRDALARVSAGEDLDHAGEGELKQGGRDQP